MLQKKDGWNEDMQDRWMEEYTWTDLRSQSSRDLLEIKESIMKRKAVTCALSLFVLLFLAFSANAYFNLEKIPCTTNCPADSSEPTEVDIYFDPEALQCESTVITLEDTRPGVYSVHCEVSLPATSWGMVEGDNYIGDESIGMMSFVCTKDGWVRTFIQCRDKPEVWHNTH